MKTLNNTTTKQTKDQVSDLEVWNGDLFKLISKASSKKEGWMKSTKAMEIEGVGCVVQVTTQQLNNTCMYEMFDEKGVVTTECTPDNVIYNSVIAEAVTFIPGVKISEEFEAGSGEVVGSRKLVKI